MSLADYKAVSQRTRDLFAMLRQQSRNRRRILSAYERHNELGIRTFVVLVDEVPGVQACCLAAPLLALQDVLAVIHSHAMAQDAVNQATKRCTTNGFV